MSLTTVKRRLRSSSFGIATFKSNTWRAILDETQTLDDAMDPTFWVDQAGAIMGHDVANPGGRGDLIQIWKADTSQFLEVIVTAIGKGFVKVAALRAYEPKDVAEPVTSPLTTKWNVGKRAHDVVRKADNTVMQGGFQNKDEAVAWIENHIKAMAA